MDVVACHLGRVGYREAWTLQGRIQKRLIEAKRADPPRDEPHVLLLLEHPPVYTLGKSGARTNLLLPEASLRERGAELLLVDRGGDITFHGPGQLVGYPILDLAKFYTDIHRYLRDLEATVIRTCAEYGLRASRLQGRTGVWIGPDANGPPRKVCAMGIRCSRWVTMHGFALNVNTDLGWFANIIPCGIGDLGVTSIREEVGESVDIEETSGRVLKHFGDRFGVNVVAYHGADAHAYLEARLGSGRSVVTTTNV